MIGQFTVDTFEFREAVQWVSRWISTRPVVPVWAGIALEAKDGNLSLSSVSEDVSSRAEIPNVEGSGAAVVSGRLLNALTATLKAPSQTKVQIGATGVRMETDDVWMSLPIVGDDDDFPQSFNSVSLPTVITMEGWEFARMVTRVAPAASRDEFAHALRAVRLTCAGDDGVLRMVASDSRRAVRVYAKTDTDDSMLTKELLVPAEALLSVAKTCGYSHTVNVGADGNLVSVTAVADDRALTIRQVAGEYPARLVDKALGYQPPLFVIVPLDTLQHAVKRALVVRTEKQPLVLSFAKDSKLTVYLTDGAAAWAGETLWVNHYDGPDVKIGINPNFLLDALNPVSGDTVLIGFDPEQPKRPIVVAEVDDASEDGYRHVVVPIDLDRAP